MIEETGRSERETGREVEHDEGRERPQRNEDVDGGPDPGDHDPDRKHARDPVYEPDDDLELGAGD